MVLIFVGILLLFIYSSTQAKMALFWAELINLFSWVFGWGGVEVLTIELIKIAIDIRKIKRILKAQISFTSDNIQSILNTNKKLAQKAAKNHNDNIELKKHI